MLLTAPMPFAAAVARLESKTPVGSPLRTKDWGQLALGLRDRAFFSAGVESMKTLAAMQGKIDEALRLPSGDSERAFMDRSKFIAEMRQALGAAPGDSGELTDLTSTKRLGLIYDFQIEDAREFGRWQAAQDPDLLDAFPAQELLRVEAREEERDWPTRWTEAGGKFFDGRMIAAKDDPVWMKISRFGRRWPPFDFGSGMGLEDIDRAEAEALGVIPPGATVAPAEADFNQGLQASVPDASPALLDGFKAIFGDQVDVSHDGKITWQGQRVLGLFKEALANPNSKWELDLGAATAEATALRPELKEARLMLKASELRHVNARHSVAEADGSQRPVTPIDLQLIPHVWRAPDQIVPGRDPGVLEFRAQIAGWKTALVFNRGAFAGARPGQAWGLRSFWAKREGVSP